MATDTKFRQKLSVLIAAGALAILLVLLARLRPGRQEIFTGATIRLYMDLESGKNVPTTQPVAVLNVADPNQVERLLCFFPQLGRRSNTAGNWGPGAYIDLSKPAGGTVTVCVSSNDLEVWTEGNGDWPVEGDLKAFLQRLVKEHVTTQPAPNGASTQPAVSSKPRSRNQP